MKTTNHQPNHNIPLSNILTNVSVDVFYTTTSPYLFKQKFKTSPLGFGFHISKKTLSRRAYGCVFKSAFIWEASCFFANSTHNFVKHYSRILRHHALQSIILRLITHKQCTSFTVSAPWYWYDAKPKLCELKLTHSQLSLSHAAVKTKQKINEE